MYLFVISTKVYIQYSLSICIEVHIFHANHVLAQELVSNGPVGEIKANIKTHDRNMSMGMLSRKIFGFLHY